MIVSFEGIDGSGKTTICRSVYEVLNQKYSQGEVNLVKFPFNENVNYDIYKLLGEDPFLSFKMSLDRNHYFATFGLPKENDLLLCDRYIHSGFAYNWAYYNKGISKVEQEVLINFELLINPEPDKIFFLDIPPSSVLERLKNKKDMQPNDIDFSLQSDVYLYFTKHFRENKCNVFFIDATKSIDVITKQIVEIILN